MFLRSRKGNTRNRYTDVNSVEQADSRRSFASDFRPCETKAGEVLPQPVSVVGLAFGGARGSEQSAARRGKRFRRAADAHDFGQLHTIEQIEIGELFGGEVFAEYVRRRDRDPSPRGCQASGLFVHVVKCEATFQGTGRA